MGRARGPCPQQPVFSSRPQSLYVCLPALLECPPFQLECRESWCSAPQLPEELHRIVSIYQATLDLLRPLQVHPEIAAQVLAYLFFFSGTLLFNQLLDKGEGPGQTARRAAERVLPETSGLSRPALWGLGGCREGRMCCRACPRGSGRRPSVSAQGPAGLSWFILSPCGLGPL